MTAPAVTVGVRAEIGQAARLMQERRVKRLPVVSDEGTLAGVISRGDLVGVYTRPDSWISGQVERVVHTDFDERGVHPEVRQGVVTLRGRVRFRSRAVALRRAARHVEGVVYVEDRVECAADDLSPFALPNE